MHRRYAMPPSGYDRIAILGATAFIGTCYDDLKRAVESGKHQTFEAAIDNEMDRLRRSLASFSGRAAGGAITFAEACYAELKKEVESGKHQTFEAAIDYEIRNVGIALARLHIDADGNVVDRDPLPSG